MTGRPHLHTALAVGAFLALAGCSSTQGARDLGPHVCFNANTVTNYAVVDRETVNLKAQGGIYQIKLLGVCPNLTWATSAIALETAGSAQVCTGVDITINAPGPTGPLSCAADSIRKLSDDEVANLPKGQRP
jgi:hypothetical protein